MALQIIRNNIINVTADAIVNTANPAVGVGRGVDQAIYEAAGWEKLLEARRQIGEMSPGEAAWTPAFDLHADYIIHTVGPEWLGGGHGERETVAKCYSNSLKLAAELGCESIAFPLIATGTYGFPKDEALSIAISEISRFLLAHEMEVMLVVYDKESFEVSGKLFSDIKAFIGDSDAVYKADKQSNRRSRPLLSRLRYRGGKDQKSDEVEGAFEIPHEAGSAIDEDLSEAVFGAGLDEMAVLREESVKNKAPAERKMSAPSYAPSYSPSYAPSFPTEKESLDTRLIHIDKTFQEYLFMLIDRRGLADSDVYKKANIDRKHFSKIRSNVDYQPSKKTALALAIALELSLDETTDLLARAGLALSPSKVFDQIIKYCIESRNYDIYEINCILFEYDQQMLGA